MLALLRALFLENRFQIKSTRLLCTLILCSYAFYGFAQTGKITGFVVDEQNTPIVSVNINNGENGTTTDENGFYQIIITSDIESTLTFSHIGFEEVRLEKITLKSNETFWFSPVLKTDVIQISGVQVAATGAKKVEGITTISPEVAQKIPGANKGVETILKLLPGVSFNNELSTQYNVRGGNFDENLVYFNGIEVYRPFLVRSAQQEGLSFINSDMLQRIKFSPGGFQAKYGDKMASVLDVTYKTPDTFNLKVSASFLGASATLENGSKNNKLSNLLGIRYRNNSLFVNSQQTQSNFRPLFVDIQDFMSIPINKSLEFEVLGAFSRNEYENEPISRQTNFGTLQEPKSLIVNYQGNEKNTYQTSFGAIKTNYNLNDDTAINLTTSVFHTQETEASDIIAAYELGDVDTDNNNFGNPINLRGIGAQTNRVRNKLDALVLNFGIRASHKLGKDVLEYGLKYTYEDTRDQLKESEFLDSAGFFIRPPDLEIANNQPETPFDAPIIPFESVDALNFVTTNRWMGFLQWSSRFEWNKHNVYVNIGSRAQHYTINCTSCSQNSQFILSPRAQIALKPSWESDVLFRLAVGSYQQPPFYRELRELSGNVNPQVSAQKSIHYVLGTEYSFNMWRRPFTFTGEGYYKSFTDVNTYTIEDVRIRYAANNNAIAYAYGLDLRLNGAFVPGTESWVSLGYLKTKENQNDRGYISRPTDQRLKFGILFQDYIPNIPNIKMYLNLVYNTGVPGGSPNDADPYNFQNRLRDYRRADLGISYIFASRNNFPQKRHWLNNFKELTVGFEIFNMFNNQNSITNTWVRDVDTQMQFAVPNFLSTRLLNIKLSFQL